MSDLIGKTLGPYRVLEQIGVGGMATVYKAYQPSMDRYVAVKILPHYLSTQDEQFLKRFQREARAIAKLEHAHILPVYDYGEHENIPYLTMRYIEAGTLKERIAKGALSLDEINHIIGQVGGALDYAHRMGVIHRDVKPGNVLIDNQGDTFLTDFGLARMLEASQHLTASGVGVGTPAYMSPEQSQGDKVDHRSDIYSLGVILYEMVTGRVPYEAETPMAVMLKHITDPLPLPRIVAPNVPETVELVILKALAKDPAARYQTAGEMVQALAAAIRKVENTETQRPAVTTLSEPTREDVSLVTRVQKLWEQPRGKAGLIGGAVVGVILLGWLLSQIQGNITIVGSGATATSAGGDGTLVGLVASATLVPTNPAEPTRTPRPTQSPMPTATTGLNATPDPLAQGERLDLCGSDLCFYDSQNRTTPVGLAKDFVLFTGPGPQFSLSPDGARIVFSGCSFTELATSGDCRSDIYIADRDGDNIVRLRGVPATYELQPSWSPDGKFIVFNEGWTVWRIDPDGIELKQIAFGELIAESYMYVWSPDSQQIAWASGLHKESGEPDWDRLYVINRDGGGLRSLLYSPDPLLTGQVAWSPDGQSLAVGFQDGTTYLFNANCDGTPIGCDRPTATQIKEIPKDWLPNFHPQWISTTEVAHTLSPQAEQARAFAEPILQAIADRPPDFEDDFSTDSQGWQPDGRCGQIADGRLGTSIIPERMVSQSDGRYTCGAHIPAVLSVTNFVFEIDLTQTQAEAQGFAGVQWRHTDGYYRVAVDMPGNRWTLARSTTSLPGGAGLEMLQEWQGPASGRIRVIGRGGQFAVYIDETPVFYLEDDLNPTGKIDLWLNASDGPVTVEYDNVKLWNLDNVPGLPATSALTPQAAQARAFAEPILAAIEDRPPDFEDDFSTANKGWKSGFGQNGNEGTMGIEDGVARLRLGVADAYFVHEALNHKDFVLQVDARLASGDKASQMQVFFHNLSSDYWFNVNLYSGLGAWDVHKMWAGQDAQLGSGAEGISLLGETTQVTIVARGSRAAVYFNGTPVAYFEDADFDTSGKTLLMCASTSQTVCEFDNLKIWNLDNVPLEPTATLSSQAEQTPAEYIISGGRDPDAGIFVDDILRIFVNSGLVAEVSQGGRCCAPVSPIRFVANIGDILRVQAQDANDCYSLEALWLQKTDGSSVTQLTKKITGPNCGSEPAAQIFFDQTFTLP